MPRRPQGEKALNSTDRNRNKRHRDKVALDTLLTDCADMLMVLGNNEPVSDEIRAFAVSLAERAAHAVAGNLYAVPALQRPARVVTSQAMAGDPSNPVAADLRRILHGEEPDPRQVEYSARMRQRTAEAWERDEVRKKRQSEAEEAMQKAALNG